MRNAFYAMFIGGFLGLVAGLFYKGLVAGRMVHERGLLPEEVVLEQGSWAPEFFLFAVVGALAGIDVGGLSSVNKQPTRTS